MTGESSELVRRQMLVAMGGLLWILPSVHLPAELRLVAEYKHLGTKTCPSAIVAPEVRVRVAILGSQCSGFLRKMAKVQSKAKEKAPIP